MNDISFKVASMVGSMPHKDPKRAVDLVFEYFPDCPCWPQLPRRHVMENMYFQYAENFPGIVMDQAREKVWVDEEKFNAELEGFYQHYIDIDTEYFRIDAGTAAGFYAMVEGLKKPPAGLRAVKLQTIGPLTFGLTVTNRAGQSIHYNQNMREAVLKNIVMKSIWQLRHLASVKEAVPAVILFLDEPYLAAYGSAFTSVSRGEIISLLTEAIDEIRKLSAQIMTDAGWKCSLFFGTHCCANTDWSILTDSPLDVISFDAYEFFENLALYSGNLNEFVKRGGVLAWGIVPNDDKIFTTNAKGLAERVRTNMGILADKGIDTGKLTENFIITPRCGVGNAAEKTAEKSLQTCGEAVKILRRL